MAYSPLPPLGQTVMASSLPVAIASNQGAVPVSAASLPLPTGAATEATLSAASAKLPASLGQKLMAASLAVVLASDQPALPVSGTFWQATQPVSIAGTVAVSGPLTDTQLRASAVPVSLASVPTHAVTQSGTWNVGTVTSLTQMNGQAISMGTGVRDAGTQRVTIATNDSVPVTGTFWQATQPVSGTFWQATQPVSLATVPLPTGAATEATLSAISGKLPATLGQKAMAASLAVVVSSDQSTMPVATVDASASGTLSAIDAVVAAPADNGVVRTGASTAGSLVALEFGPGHGTWSAQFTGAALGTTLYFELSIDSTNGTDGQWIGATMLQEGENDGVIASSTATNSSVWRGSCGGAKWGRVRAVGGAIGAGATVKLRSSAGTSGVHLNEPLPAGINNIGDVDIASVPALTKGTQGSTGFSVQNLKDAGRAIVNAATAIAGVTCVTAEALLSLNVSRDCAATAAATSITVTSGKRLRVQAIVVGIRSTSAAVLSGRISLRMNPSGAVTATSPIIATVSLSQKAAALAEAGNELCVPIPDGVEFSGTMQFGLSQVCSAITGVVYASIIGYEY
jgi:hypothetical protein